MEAALLGGFMASACAFCVLLEHPAGPVRRRLTSAFARRLLMGLAMGLTAVALIRSPWGQQSGAHMNPATTLAFWSLGKVAPVDAFFYILAQFAGGVAGVALSRLALGRLIQHAAVNYVVTTPGPSGPGPAWVAECAIAFGLMLTVLYVSNDAALAPYTAWFAGALVAIYITVEAPLSGMSMNPARSFGSAAIARHWKAYWVYLTAPVAGMLLASGAYAALPTHGRVYCAKLDHCNNRPCIFHCQFDQLRPRTLRPAAAERPAPAP